MPEQQLHLGDWLPYKEDRNAGKGGRSFYFFDFDDNILHLDTRLILFHRDDHSELEISSEDLSRYGADIGKKGPFGDYYIDNDDRTGSFRNFRDMPLNFRRLIRRRPQTLTEDVRTALLKPVWDWHGPSWNHFFYAVLNRRPVSIITARGHSPRTLRNALNELTRQGHLYRRPNILSLYPVTNPRLRRRIFQDPEYRKPVSELKSLALFRAVEDAFRKYGRNPYHRFGVSDDDPANIREITNTLIQVKKRYPENAFFVIDTSGEGVQKTEIFPDHVESSRKIGLSDALNYQLFDF